MRALGFAGLVLLVLPACALRTPGSPPSLGRAQPEDLPAAFSMSGAETFDDRWWTAFDDATLERLVETALEENLTLEVAKARVARAAALARRAGAPLSPQLNLTTGADVVHSRRELGSTIFDDNAGSLSLGALASYEVDLWGRIGATQDAAILDVQASCADLDAARVTIAASVASTWYQLVEQARIEAVLREQVETNETLQILLEGRFDAGKIGAADVLRQRQLIERIHGDLTLAASRKAVFAHLLATLQGRAATDGPPEAPPRLIDLGPMPSTGVPSLALHRRPDVQAAWWRVRAADRTLAASIADRYPRLDLSAALQFGGAGFEVLFIDRVASIAADLVAPVVDGGRRKAQVDADLARRRELLQTYADEVLTALREVEDALVQEQKKREHLESLERQHELSKRVVETLLGRYGQGATSYLDVLAAIQSEQNLSLSIVTARRQLITYRIDLCRALAGPWCPGEAKSEGASK